MQVLRPMTDAEYAPWLADTLPSYAADKVASGRWAQDESLERARKEYAQLLPQGLQTPDNHFFTVIDTAGEAVGALWFAEAPRVGHKVAYVFDIVTRRDRQRQGHARRALLALEAEAARRGLAGIALNVFGSNAAGRALYAALGYEPTNINLYKPLPAVGPPGA